VTVLVVTAVAAERDAVLAKLDRDSESGDPGAGPVDVACCGVGPAAAAAGAATLLARGSYDLVVCAGIAGGFRGRAAVRDVVLADRIVHADLGADSPAGFLALDELGFGDSAYVPDPALVSAAAARIGGVVVGPVLTVSTATGTDERAAQLTARHAAVAEGMEGAGVYAAALAASVPMLELRAISNLVGRREPSAWDIPGALMALGDAVAAVVEVPLGVRRSTPGPP
jgi:futalosine hydrolase